MNSVVGKTTFFIRNFFEKFFAPNFPFFITFIFTVQLPEALVLIFPLFNLHAPETDHVFFPVELVEAIDEVAYLEDGSSTATFHFRIGMEAALADGTADEEIKRHVTKQHMSALLNLIRKFPSKN
jgi:hypothetical protein